MFDRFPQNVTLTEVGLRDGFQFEAKTVPTDMKLEIVRGLIDAGLSSIQVTSFVNTERVPQMADAEVLMKRLPPGKGVVYSALVLNLRGLERAVSCGVKSLEISVSASDAHGRNNTGMGLEEAVRQSRRMVRLARQAGVRVRGGIQCAFGCVHEGAVEASRVQEIAAAFMEEGVASLCLADTTGMADPPAIAGLMEKILPGMNGIEPELHLHDTRGLGLVNVMTALGYGVRRFDASLAGMGGCPFVPRAAGNIASEDLVNFMHSLKIETGIDIRKLAACSVRLEAFFGKRFPGRMHRLMV